MDIILFEKISLFITVATNAFLLYFFLNQKNKTLHTWAFIYFLLGSVIWSGAILSTLFHMHGLWLNFIFGGSALGLTALFIFIKSYINNQRALSYFDFMIITIGFFFVCVSFWHNALFLDMTIMREGYLIVERGNFAKSFSLFTLVYSIAPLVYFSHRRRTMNIVQKKKYDIFFYGLTTFVIVNLLTNSILPNFFQINYFNVLGPVLLLQLTLFVFYIIYKHNFLDIKLVIQRSAIYLVLLLFIANTYIISVFTLTHITASLSPAITAYTSAGIALLIGFVSVPHLDRWLRRITNPWFFKDYYDFDRVTRSIYDGIERTVETESMMTGTITHLVGALHPEHIAIISYRDRCRYTESACTSITDTPIMALHDREPQREINLRRDELTDHTAWHKWMQHNSYILCIPITYDQKPLGSILLGEKKSGDSYYKNDLLLIRQTAMHLSTGMERAFLFDQKKREASILQKKVDERTQEISALQKSQEHMMVNIAHTLKTPLTILYNEIAALAEHDSALKTDSITRTIDDVSKLISSLLMLARAESSAASSGTSEPLDIGALVELLADHLRPTASEAGISITVTSAPDLIIRASHDHVEETLVTLIENAIKYTAPSLKNPKSIHISTSHDAHDVICTISDTGIGISAGDMPHVFGRFYRGESALTHKIQGSGIGLAICKALIRQNGGTIHVESALDDGTTFTLRFPRYIKSHNTNQKR